ncbi:MAG: SurA N-terminal domain-containing protein [Candidatus Omnitrophica bacterium]|nr:SurA N-terminal domain-containing protein [Candidatus Omnitrophota bacterium]
MPKKIKMQYQKKNIAFLLITFLCLSMVGGCSPKEKPAIIIDSIKISPQEFEQAYEKENLAQQGKLNRKEFLEFYINRKLMLKEAEKLNLDKDPQFLENLQIFWEQALLKLVLSRKINELTLAARVSEEEIESYYQRHKDTDYAGKSLEQVREQIKLLIFKIKQRLQLKNWENNLRKRAKITIDYNALGIPQE